MKHNTKLNISRRILGAVIFICLALSVFSVQAFAAKDAGAGIEWRIEGDTLIVSGHGEMRDFTEHDTPPWHSYRDDIRLVIIDDGITSVGDLAFYKYDNVVSVILAPSVKSIGAYAFSDCTSLEMISFGRVEVIESSAFARCSALTSVRLPSSLISIENKAFYRCTSLLAVYIPESVSQLGNMIFTYCDKLVGASIEANVQSVPEWMFYGCTNLAEVVLGGSITSAEDRAFYGCESFTYLYYPSGNENTLVESIKSSSIPTFVEQNLRGDTPTNDEFDGAIADMQDNVITQTTITLSEGTGSMISTSVTEQIEFTEEGFNTTSSSVSIEALIDSESGWNELLERINRALDEQLSSDGSIHVVVRLQTITGVPSEILAELSGKNVQLDVHQSNGAFFGIDCRRLTSFDAAQPAPSLDCTVTKDPELSEKHKDVLEGADTYKVTYEKDISIDFSSKVYVGKDNAHSIATIYVEKAGGLDRIQSAVVDKGGYATFYLQALPADTEIILGLNVKGETIENAIIPDSMAVDNHALLDRYRPIEYAVVDDREFLGLNSWQFALVVAGVVLGIVIVVSVIAVIIYRKKRLQLMHEMKKRQARKK